MKIEQISTKKELNEFIRFPWRVYQGNPNWVPPLLEIADAHERVRARHERRDDARDLGAAFDRGLDVVGVILVRGDDEPEIALGDELWAITGAV